jgi:flagellar protein FliO/FliZ
MKKILSVLFVWLACFVFAHAEEVVSDVAPLGPTAINVTSINVTSVDVPLVDVVSKAATPVEETVIPVEVGKHVTANMNSMSMIMSLLMVLAVIVVSAMILKRFQGVSQSHQGLKIVTSLHLGSKEKVVVVQAGDKQLLLGVTTQQITLLETLDKPLVNTKGNSVDFAQSIAKLLKQKAIKTYDKQK